MSSPLDRIAQNLLTVRGRIAEACRRSGRDTAAVRLVAVTKYVDLETIGALCEAGATDLGESRPQQLWQRAELLRRPDVTWHLIGHLQRNKVRRTLPSAGIIHSVDSLDLVASIDRIAAELRLRPMVLLEVNIAGEAAKTGLSPGALPEIVASLDRYQSVDVRGLMTMAPLDGNLDDARAVFAALREIRDRLSTAQRPLAELSMGMSGDFEVAIEEGATIVRVGSALFEGLA